jgi:hypothetical protein
MIAAQQPLTPQEQLEVERVRKLLLGSGAPVADRAHFVPLSPQSPENGTKCDAEHGDEPAEPVVVSATESEASLALAASGVHDPSEAEHTENGRISYRAAEVAGTQLASCGEPLHKDRTCASSLGHGCALAPATSEEPDENPMRGFIARALTQAKRGRPAAFDEHARGKLVALLALGLSVRQSATVLGVSHPTVLRALNADPDLREEVAAARYQAQLQPLGCVIREAQRSWRAATWLLKYLDGKLAGHEETPEEKREREHREKLEEQIRMEERVAAREGREKQRREQAQAEKLARERAEIEAMFPRRRRKPKAEPGQA